MDLPAVDRLGCALDLTDITSFDIDAVDNRIIVIRRLIRIDFGNVRDVVINGMTYSVPWDVSVATDNQIDGRADASYPLRYFAVSGTTSGAYAARKSFLEGQQHAFLSFTYSARLRDLSLVEAPLINGLSGIPKPFNSSDTSTVRKYRDFFRDYGSHIIHHVNYGTRYPLNVWASNATPAVNNTFNTNVKAKFSGIPSGGDYNASVMTQGGGDIPKIANTDATYVDYQNWIKSIKEQDPSLLNFQVIEVWTLMKFAESTDLRSYADPLYDAFMWIIGYVDVYKTAVTLNIESDWAAFDLLTSSATIVPDPANPYPVTNTVASDTRVQWGKEYSHDYYRLILRFFIVNDGSPIDFSISHGSLAGPSAQGKAIVTMEGRIYTNDVITDNVWNMKWFYNAPVSSTPVPQSANYDRASIPFNDRRDILKGYLREFETRATA